MMLRRTVLAAPLAVILPASGCRAAERSGLRIIVPNAPGSGYDLTARTMATVLDSAGIAPGVDVFNLPGSSGMVGLRRLVYERGNGDLAMVMGLGLVGAQQESPITVTLADVTPIARLIEEPEVVVVTHDSPFREIADLAPVWRAHPQRLAVGGGSAGGGPDHMALMLLAKAVGVEPASVNYVRFDGGGNLLAAILAKRVAFAVSSLGEYAEQIGSGQLRVLAVTSAGRAPTMPAAPTLREVGLDVVFSNWRGLVAPPGLTTQDSERLASLAMSLHTSALWQQMLARHGWTDSYLPGKDFGGFLATEHARVAQVRSTTQRDSARKPGPSGGE